MSPELFFSPYTLWYNVLCYVQSVCTYYFSLECTPMPVTRRRRANPPEQPENNNHLAEQPENTAGAVPTEQPAESPVAEERPSLPMPSAPAAAAPTEDNAYQQL